MCKKTLGEGKGLPDVYPSFIYAFLYFLGFLYGLSTDTWIDRDDCCALVPHEKSTRLVLSLNIDTYQRLGLQGRKAKNNKYGEEKYDIPLL